jgi:hypothetical protein
VSEDTSARRRGAASEIRDQKHHHVTEECLSGGIGFETFPSIDAFCATKFDLDRSGNEGALKLVQKKQPTFQSLRSARLTPVTRGGTDVARTGTAKAHEQETL